MFLLEATKPTPHDARSKRASISDGTGEVASGLHEAVGRLGATENKARAESMGHPTSLKSAETSGFLRARVEFGGQRCVAQRLAIFRLLLYSYT